MTLLTEEVGSVIQLKLAWEHVKKKKDVTPGIDDVTIELFSHNLESNLEQVSTSLKSKTYRFEKVISAEIPKREKNKTRTISIYALKDKIVQKSLQISLEKKRGTQSLFPEIRNKVSIGFLQKLSFNESSGVRLAVEKIKDYFKQGYIVMTATDIKDFFPSIDQKRLLKSITARLPDKSLNWLIELAVHPDVVKKDRYLSNSTYIPTTTSGISQGSILSPLFSNIYLMEFDKELEKLGISALRYADDFCFFSESHQVAKANLLKVQSALAEKSGLSFHNTGRKKIKFFDLKNGGGRYLGLKFQLKFGKWQIRPIDEKIDELKEIIKKTLQPKERNTFSQRVEYLNRCIRSWYEAYKHAGCSRRDMREVYSKIKEEYDNGIMYLLQQKGIITKKLLAEQLEFLGIGTSEIYKRRNLKKRG